MNLTPDQQKIAALQGQMHAMRVAIKALLVSTQSMQQQAFAGALDELAEAARAQQLALAVPDQLIQAFEDELLAIRVRPAP